MTKGGLKWGLASWYSSHGCSSQAGTRNLRIWFHIKPPPLAHTSLSFHYNKGMPLWSSLEGSDWELRAGGSLQPCPYIPHLQGTEQMETEPEASPYLEGCILDNLSPREFVRTNTSSYELVLLQFNHSVIHTRHYSVIHCSSDMGSPMWWLRVNPGLGPRALGLATIFNFGKVTHSRLFWLGNFQSWQFSNNSHLIDK